VKPASPGPGATGGAPNSTLRGLVLNVSAAQQAGDALTAMNASVQELSARVGYDTLPRVNSLADDVRSAVHSVDRAAVPTLFRLASKGPSDRFRPVIN
jgi:hypothetical protein